MNNPLEKQNTCYALKKIHILPLRFLQIVVGKYDLRFILSVANLISTFSVFFKSPTWLVPPTHAALPHCCKLVPELVPGKSYLMELHTVYSSSVIETKVVIVCRNDTILITYRHNISSKSEGQIPLVPEKQRGNVCECMCSSMGVWELKLVH